MLDASIQATSLYLPLKSNAGQLHIKHFSDGREGEVVLLVHGALENGRIFYHQGKHSMKGLAPYLAQQGFDVYVLDLRGRGLSTPPIDANSTHGQSESIMEDIPLVIDYLCLRRKGSAQHWIAHSWGGVLLASVLARYAKYRPLIKSQVYFGSKRQVKVKSLRRLFYIELMWRWVCCGLVQYYGYLPARRFRIGADSESEKSHRQSLEWVYGKWLDSDDAFDYGKAISETALAPTLYFAAKKDPVLGHPEDVKRFMKECGKGAQVYWLLSKANGNLHDYDHIDMLTHPNAAQDHFPWVVTWLNEQRLPR